MSIFSNPAANFSTAPFILDEGEINLKIASVKAKVIERNDGTQAGIIELGIRVASGEFAGKPLSNIQCWYDDTGANPNVMRWVMAALGHRAGSEAADAAFKAEYPSLDLSFEEGSLKPASGWEHVLNSIVTVSVGRKWNDKRDPAQYENTFKNIRPVG